jgi:hypothetical protein
MNAEENANRILNDMKRQKEEEAKLSAAGSDHVVVETVKEWSLLAKFWYQFVASLVVILNRVIIPFYSWTGWLFSVLVFRPWRKLWARTVYKTNAAGVRRFSSVRGAGMIAATVVAAYIGFQALFVLADAALYLITGRVDEVVYMSNAQEISGEDNLHSAQGCTITTTDKDFSCDADNSLYFRIAPSAFNHLWSLWHKHTLFFPDYVAAPIAPGWEQCVITSYGIRAKFFMKQWDIYPTLLSATCKDIAPGQGVTE